MSMNSIYHPAVMMRNINIEFQDSVGAQAHGSAYICGKCHR